jgi:hypothetical protein
LLGFHTKNLALLTTRLGDFHGTKSRRARPLQILTIDYPIRTMAIPIRTGAYSISMPCRLTAQVTGSVASAASIARH